MIPALKKWCSQLLWIGNMVACLLSLAAIVAPYINPAMYWPFAIAGIGFPISIVVVALFALLWLFLKPKRALLSAITLMLCSHAIYLSFGLHPFGKFTQAKDSSTLRVMSWNVGLMNYETLDTNLAIAYNKQIFEKIKQSNADVLCLQEFFSAIVPGNHYNIMDSLSRKLGYPYYYFSRDVPKINNQFYSGTIIYSRYPIVDSSIQRFPFKGLFSGSVIKTGIVKAGDTINIVSSRLQIMRFSKEEYQQLSELKHLQRNSYLNSKSLIGKLRTGYYFLSKQATIVDSMIRSSNRATLFGGDINNIPISHTYATVKGNLHDAWANGGWGIGRTFHSISPTLRVDQLFYSHHFSLQQVRIVKAKKEADHNALLADFLLKTK